MHNNGVSIHGTALQENHKAVLFMRVQKETDLLIDNPKEWGHVFCSEPFASYGPTAQRDVE